MSVKKLFSYVNVLYLILSALTFLKLIYFTFLIHSELATPLLDSQYVFGKLTLSYLFCAFSVYTLGLVVRGKKSLIILIVLSFLVNIFIYGNLIYFRSFDSFLSIYNIQQYRNFGVVGTSALALIQLKDIIFFIEPILLVVFYKRLKKYFLKQEPYTTRQAILVSLIPIGAMGMAINYNDFFAPELTKVQISAKLSIIGNQYYDLASFVDDSRNTVSKRDVYQEVDSWYKEKNKEKIKLQYQGLYKGKNLIVLQVESLEGFVIDRKINNQEITPTLNKLAHDGIYFSNIKEQVNGGNSSDADFIVNNSLLPLKSGSVGHRYPKNHYNSLPVILRNNDYSSHVIHCGEGYFWNKENFLPNYGFDSYTDIEGMNRIEKEMFFMGLKDKEHLKQVANNIKNYQDKFYAFTVTETSHTPFEIPEEMQYLKLDEEFNQTVFGKYFQAIRYTDEAIKDFITQLDKQGQLKNSIVVIYGDHEGVHKYNNEEVLKKNNKEYLDYVNEGRVPFIIYTKDNKLNKKIDKLGGQVDIMPTILSLLGIEQTQYQNTAMGTSLLSDRKGYVIDRNGIVFGDDLSKQQEENVAKAIDVSEKIIKANYFKEYYKPSANFIYNNEKE